MRLLLDSSGAELLCALADEQGVFLEVRHPTGTAQSRDIGTVAGQLLGELAPVDLRGIVVGLGPGTFIGTRVAVSYANGLAAAGGVPLFGVNSLAALCAVHCSQRSVVLRDAGRQQVYLYSPQPEECGCFNLDRLEIELLRLRVGLAVLELPAEPSSKQQARIEAIHFITGRAGVAVAHCGGVPSEGLRRAAAVVPAQDYLEPVYLRGFL
jgi:tRNA threonylcarbamoyl adenosine modification protein YeaZ